MTRSRGLLVMSFFISLVLLPSKAFAIGWWDWLEQLSGPGPFANGWVFDTRILCGIDTTQLGAQAQRTQTTSSAAVVAASPFKGGDRASACRRNTDAVRSFLEFRYGKISTDEKPLFDDAPGGVRGVVTAQTMQVYAMQQFGAVALGSGAGIIWFTGDPLDHTPKRIALTPITFAFMPLQLIPKLASKEAGRAFVIRAEGVMPLGELTAQDFYSASPSRWRSKNELLKSVSMTVDTLWIIDKLKGR